ncbi:fimbrial protein [Photorhabdus akhurstii]|uniref:PhfS n=1 Tax=Photorhabdus luminescens TaxID=29488 RepID=Q8GFD1_PHOLU|nr:fimbrial protein [Photorhabdus akhurstii]AAO17170.1 PhfS [Photorhabdus luminescens]MBS9428714.1 type 1 fimbrial protein [Photorhabdus akhurstii]PQQ42002.1 type 1 fimbrial protein [Photorhabdus luminescens]
MKKNFILASLVAVLGIFSSFSALSYDGTIKFRGTIIEQTCTVKGTSGKDIAVNFDNVHKSKLDGKAGKFSDPKSFTVNLTGCPDLKGFDVKFDDTDKTSDGNYFKILSSSTAKNIAIALYKSGSSTPIKPGDSIKIPGVAGDTSFNLESKLVSTAATVTAGSFTRDINFTISYP